MNRTLNCLLLALPLFFSAKTVHANDLKESVAVIHQMEANDDGTAVCIKANEANPTIDDDLADILELYYYRAECAMSVSNFDEAEPYYRVIIENYPDAGPALISYARLLEKQNRVAEALDLYKKVLLLSPPDNIRALVMARLSELSDGSPEVPFGGGSLSLGYVFDSNINSSTSAKSIELFGLLFNVVSKPIRDHGYQLSGSYAGTMYRDGYQLYGRVDGTTTSYQSTSDFNPAIINLTGGLRIPYSNLMFDLPLAGSATWIGGERFKDSIALRPRLWWAPAESDFSYSIGYNLERLNYPALRDRDGLSQSVTLGARKIGIFTNSDFVEAEISTGKVGSVSGDYSTHEEALTARYYLATLGRATFLIEFNKLWQRYDRADVMFDTNRSDSSSNIGIFLSHPCGPAVCAIKASHQENGSVIPFYEYKRDVITLQSSFNF